MDYKTIYYKIIENAKKETENENRHVGYYEKHHIQPKSLGGTNDKENLVKLTAREHFICHWLLVKMYDKGTIERNKMLCALWKMRCISKNHKRYINSRAYEALRIEFAKIVSKANSINQQGNKNSQFGKKWYTNRNTGESKKFKEKPVEYFWIEGRNLFKGNELWSIITKHKITSNKKRNRCGEYKSLRTRFEYRNELYLKGLMEAKILWNQYHSGDYKKLEDMAIELGISKIALHNKFKKYIPIYSKHDEQKRKHFLPDKNLINVFE